MEIDLHTNCEIIRIHSELTQEYLSPVSALLVVKEGSMRVLSIKKTVTLRSIRQMDKLVLSYRQTLRLCLQRQGEALTAKLIVALTLHDLTVNFAAFNEHLNRLRSANINLRIAIDPIDLPHCQQTLSAMVTLR